MKRILIPAVVLVVILAIWIVQSKIEENRIRGKTIENFMKLERGKVNKITIKTASEKLSFFLKDGRWYVDGDVPKLADSAAIDNMINTAANLRVGNVISENPERQRDFQVDTISGSAATFFDGDRELASIIIGKMTPDFAHSYVRAPGSNDVYLSEGMITYIFNRRRAQWLNRSIFSFQPELAREAEFIYPDKQFHIRKGLDAWYVSKAPYADSLPTDSMKTDVFLRQAGNLKASDFANEADSGKYSFSPPALSIKVSLLNGSTQTVDFSPTDTTANRLYCRQAGSDDVFVISKGLYNNMLKQFADFLP
jgi:hypothetical protein